MNSEQAPVRALRILGRAFSVEDYGELIQGVLVVGSELEGSLIGGASPAVTRGLQSVSVVQMELLVVRPDLERFGVGLGRVAELAELMVRDAEIEQAFETLRGILNQSRAIRNGGFIIVLRECARRESFERCFRGRPER